MEGIANVIDNREDAKNFKVCEATTYSVAMTTNGANSEHLRNIRLRMGNIRHLSRRLPRQTRIRLVRFLDNPLQSLCRRRTLLPSRGNIAFFIGKHH